MVQYGFVMCKYTLVVISPSEMDEIAKIGLEAFQTPHRTHLEAMYRSKIYRMFYNNGNLINAIIGHKYR